MRKLQDRLNSLGIRDIKIYFSPIANKLTKNQLGKQVRFILSTYLDGYKIKLPRFKD